LSFDRFALVKQRSKGRALADVAGAVRKELNQSGLATRMRPGARIALAVGSRGIDQISTIVRACVAFWKDQRCSPFIVPAMGSHGGASDAGQARVLAEYGIDEQTVGCPVYSSMEVLSIAKTHEGINVLLDRNAFLSDAIMPISRIKWHTNFEGGIESGLLKMLSFGLGKARGAQEYHAYAVALGMERVIRAVSSQVLQSGKVIGGLAILEDAHHAVAEISVVEPHCMIEVEEQLLRRVKSWMPRIPVNALDLLIVNEIGKDISGSGMDTKVVNRGIDGEYNPWDTAPQIARIYVRGLSKLTHGNAIGIGLADVVHERILSQIDWQSTRVNALSASAPASARLPVHFANDRECLAWIMQTLKHSTEGPAIGWIRNSVSLESLLLAENFIGELQTQESTEILKTGIQLAFDKEANLIEPTFA
jgi:hypothetical protein